MSDKQKLFHSIINYLSADKDNAESFQVAIDILKNSSQFDEKSKHDKNDLLEIYSKNTSKLSSEEKKTTKKLSFFTTPLVTEEEKFEELISVITSKGFFKGVEKGTEEYNKRLEKAKAKFTERQKKLQEEADEFKEKGNKLFSQKKYTEASECYLKGIEKFSTHVFCYANLGSCLISLRKYEHAVEALERAIKVDPKYAKGYARLGVALSNLGRHDEALESVEKALELDPKNNVFKKHRDQIESRASRGGLSSIPNLFGGGGGSGGMPDLNQLNQLFSNPEIMKMATSVMQQPGFQDMLGNFMQNMGNSGPNQFNKESIKELEQYEEYQKSKKIQDAVKDISENGMGSMSKYVADSEIQGFFLKVAQDKMRKATGGSQQEKNEEEEES